MAVTAVVINNNNLYQITIDVGQEVSVGSHKKDDIYVADFAQSQIKIKYKTDGISVNAKKAYNFYTDDIPLDRMTVLSMETKTALFFSSESSQSRRTIKLPYNCEIHFGRNSNNNVTIKYDFISGNHFIIKNEAGSVRVEDLDSTNGLYLNGKRVHIARMKSGDTLSVFSINIKLLNGVLYFENVGNRMLIKKIDDGEEVVKLDCNTAHLKYLRSPRTQERLPYKDIVLDSAPSKGQKYQKGRGMFSSVISSGAMMLSSIAMGAASPALIAARAIGLVSPMVNMASSGGSDKKRKKSLELYETMRREKYGAYIDDQKAKIESVAKIQREIITRENPSPKECIDILTTLRRSLWERIPTDRDFLDIRLGMGYENLCVNVKSQSDSERFRMEDDEIRELSEQIIEETRIVDNVPARVSLLKNNTVGIIGDRRNVISLVRNMIAFLTVTHCFEDVRIVGVFDRREQQKWEFLKWIPHIWDDENKFRFLAFDKENTHNVCDALNEILKVRKETLSGNSYRNNAIPKPYYIVVFGSKELIENEPVMNNIFENDPAMGVTSLFLFDDTYHLPKDCRYIIDVDNGPCAYEKDKVDGKFCFTADENIADYVMDRFARMMSSVELEGFAGKTGLPDGITFLEGYGVKTPEEISVFENWQKAKPYKSLAAPIGVLGNGKTFYLDVNEKKHGCNGIMAGMVGSGKSEVLITWILSMAIQFSPTDISFVIIDYKGGGMANRLEKLPHVVGKITNIDSNIGRSLISLKAENLRRQQLFAEYGVDHIDKYQKLYKEGVAKEPMPHLIIVSDEFAELKKEEPEFMKELVSTARVGRALGIKLLLATQKPGGVVDEQIRSNTYYWICLKVANAADSREMIKRPNASQITRPGRAYIMIGEDLYFDVLQTYWSGAAYHGNEVNIDDGENKVRIVAMSGQRIKTVRDKAKRSDSDIDELKVVVEHICSVAEQHGIKRLPGPWLPELPEKIYIGNITNGIGFNGKEWIGTQKWLTCPIGVFDSPETQSQGTQYYDLNSDGHLGIYGAPGTGKTTMLKTIVMSLGMVYSPKDINFYILDCGGWSMNAFADMPHVGGVALDFEEEKFSKLEKMIFDELESRKRKFLKNSVGSLASYRESVSDDIPAIVIAVDNIVAVFELYPDIEKLFVTIASDGGKYGIYLIYTANSTTGVKYKMLANIKGAVAFELTDKGDYSSIVGRLNGKNLPDAVGRAFFKGNPPIEFQAADYADGDSDRQKSESLKNIIGKMNSSWNGVRPKPIPVMPENVSVDSMISEYKTRTVLPVGIGYSGISTSFVDLTDSYSLVVSGSVGSGKSAFLEKIIRVINAKFDDTKIFVFDSLKKSLSSVSSSVYKYACVNDEESVTDMLSEMIDYLNNRKRAQNQERQKEDCVFDEKEFIMQYEMLCIVIDDLKEFVDSVTDSDKLSMERIARLAQDLGVVIVAAGRMADITRYNEIESLTRVLVENQNGLVTDGTPAQYGFFRNNLKYNEKDIEAGEGNGWLFLNGRTEKIKIMS